MNQHILIAGGGGYIGSVLTRCLLERGYHVTCLDRFFFGLEPIESFKNNPSYRWVRGDTRSIGKEVFAGVDAVVDMAALSNDPSGDLDGRLTEEINFQARVRLAKLARDAGVKRYILASSCSVYGQGASQKLDEKSEAHPITAYAKANVRAERGIFELASQSFTPTALRQATVYGLSPRMRFDLVINLMTISAVQKGKIFVMGGGKQWRPLVHVEDTSRAFIKALEAPANLVASEIFNVGSSEQNHQILQLAYIVREALPFHVEVEIAPDDADRRDYNVSFEKVKRVLDFVPGKTPADGAKEIYHALKHGTLEQTPTTVTVKWYKYLLEADAILKDIKIDGHLL